MVKIPSINPCNGCGQADQTRVIRTPQKWAYVGCTNCGRHTPEAPTEFQAITNWNNLNLFPFTPHVNNPLKPPVQFAEEEEEEEYPDDTEVGPGEMKTGQVAGMTEPFSASDVVQDVQAFLDRHHKLEKLSSGQEVRTCIYCSSYVNSKRHPDQIFHSSSCPVKKARLIIPGKIIS